MVGSKLGGRRVVAGVDMASGVEPLEFVGLAAALAGVKAERRALPTD